MTQQDISFLPDEFLARRNRRRSDLVLALLVCALVTAVGIMRFIAFEGLRNAQAQQQAMQRNSTSAIKLIAQISAMESRQEISTQRVELTSQLQQKIPPSQVLSELAKALAGSASLKSLTLDSTPQKQTLIMTGIASSDPQIAVVIRRLGRSLLFGVVARLPVDPSADPTQHLFSLKVDLNPAPNSDIASPPSRIIPLDSDAQ